MNKVVKAVHELVTQGKMPAKSVAIAIGKPYSTLLRETNPLDPGAKLGVETFMAIIETTGDGCSPPLSCEAVSPQGQACSRVPAPSH